MKDFFKAFLSFGLATSLGKLLGFIILPIYTRKFTKTEYGIIDMTNTVLAVASIFSLLQLETSLQRYYYEYNGLKRKLLISNIYFFIGVCSIIIGLILFLFAPTISLKLFNSKEYGNLIKIVSIQLPLDNFNLLGLVLLRYQKENAKFFLIIITKVTFSLSFVYLFVLHLKLGLSGVFYAQVCSSFFSTLLAIFFVRNSFIMRVSRTLSIKNFKYALPQFPAGVGSMVVGQANRFFMLSYLSLGAIGTYSVSMKLASSIQLVNTAFVLAWAPFMHGQFKNKNNKLVFANVFPIVVGFTFLCVSLISLFSQEMIKLLATHEFYNSYKYVGGLALFFALYIIKETVDIGPKIKEKTKFLSFTFLLSVIVNVSSLFFFIKKFGIEGVVYSMIITNLFLVIISWSVSNRLYFIPFSIPKFVTLIIPALALAISSIFFDLPLFQRFLIAGLCVTFYGILLLKFFINFRAMNIFQKSILPTRL